LPWTQGAPNVIPSEARDLLFADVSKEAADPSLVQKANDSGMTIQIGFGVEFVLAPKMKTIRRHSFRFHSPLR
jgi:hypothetical protein